MLLAILKINGDELLKTTDDGAFMNVLKHYFNSLHEPLYPDSQNSKARSLTVSIIALMDNIQQANMGHIRSVSMSSYSLPIVSLATLPTTRSGRCDRHINSRL